MDCQYSLVCCWPTVFGRSGLAWANRGANQRVFSYLINSAPIGADLSEILGAQAAQRYRTICILSYKTRWRRQEVEVEGKNILSSSPLLMEMYKHIVGELRVKFKRRAQSARDLRSKHIVQAKIHLFLVADHGICPRSARTSFRSQPNSAIYVFESVVHSPVGSGGGAKPQLSNILVNFKKMLFFGVEWIAFLKKTRDMVQI